MKRNRWSTRLACGLLVAATTLGVALAAGTQGSRSDPLVTLSYLNEKVIPDVMKQVDEHIKVKTAELETKVQTWQNQVAFSTVEIEGGKTMTPTVGTQLVLRSGTATGDGLLDVTTGEVYTGTLIPNHLYIAIGEGQKVTITERGALLILGEYAV